MGKPKAVRRYGGRAVEGPPLPAGQSVAERLELQCQMARLHDDLVRHHQLDRREVEDCLAPEREQPVGDRLRRLGRGDQHRHVDRLTPELLLQRVDAENGQAVPLPADLARVAVEDGDDIEPALAEAAVLDQRTADLPRPDQRDPVAPLEPQNFPETVGQLGHRIPQAALAERAEEGEVLPHLRRGGAATRGERAGAYGGHALPLEFLEEAQIQREPPDSRLGDLTHGSLSCETFHKSYLPGQPPSTSARCSRTNTGGARVSGRAAGSISVRLSTSATRSGAHPVSSRSPRPSCFRRKPKRPTVVRRKAGSSASVTRAGWNGVSRRTAESTLGRGWKAPAGITNSRSARATACTPTLSAP